MILFTTSSVAFWIEDECRGFEAVQIGNEDNEAIPVGCHLHLPLAGKMGAHKCEQLIRTAERQRRPGLMFRGVIRISGLNLLCDDPEGKGEHDA
jgi:hypothetical protein